MRRVVDADHRPGTAWLCEDHDDRGQSVILAAADDLAAVHHRTLTEPVELEPWQPSDYMKRRQAELAAQREN